MNQQHTIRVRFAPSPTGELHLGGARVALFNWLFARHHQGLFHLRIEDTDRKRSRPEYVDQICDSLRWLNMTWDGPFMYQSRRGEAYRTALQDLLKSGAAYRCFCSRAEPELTRPAGASGKRDFMYPGTCRNLSAGEVQRKLNQSQSSVVRLRIPEGETVFHDRIYGTIRVQNRELDDFIIARSDGHPTYNLVVVVDDHTMGITHVIRGEDHISNTPKQILVYQALGFPLPEFAHLPMILGPDRKRLSKRHNAPGIQQFQEAGYLPAALLNYLALLGWNPDTGQEIFTAEELIRDFRLRQVQKKSAVYDAKKLDWISGQHMLRLSGREILQELRALDPDWHTERDDDVYNIPVIALLQPRCKSLREVIENSRYFYDDPATYEDDVRRKHWPDRAVNALVDDYRDGLDKLKEWSKPHLEQLLRDICTERGLPAGKLIHPVRLAVSGTGRGPGLFEMMELLGREVCLRRLKLALEKLP